MEGHGHINTKRLCKGSTTTCLPLTGGFHFLSDTTLSMTLSPAVLKTTKQSFGTEGLAWESSDVEVGTADLLVVTAEDVVKNRHISIDVGPEVPPHISSVVT